MAGKNLNTFFRYLTRTMVAKTLIDEPDQLLVNRFLAERDPAAFEALIHRHGPMVYRVCRQVVQHDQDAEDAFQATFLVLAQHLRTVRKHASVASWLHGVARRIALKAKSQAATRRQQGQPPPLPKALPADEVTWREVRTVLDEELAKLAEKWRLPLILCYLEGRTQDEAAVQLGWSKNTLRRHLEKARAALGRRLRGRGVVWPAALAAILLSDAVAPAGLRPALVVATVEALASLTGGQAAMTHVSAKVVALTEGGLKTMSLSKLKIATAVLILVALLGAGVGTTLLNYQAHAEDPPKEPPKPSAKDVPAPNGDHKITIVERGSIEPILATDLVCGLKASTIKWIVEDGTMVKKGDRLIELDDTDLREQIRERKKLSDQALTAKTTAEENLAIIRKENQLAESKGEIEVKLAKLRLRKSPNQDPDEKEILELKVKQAQLEFELGQLQGRSREARAESDLKAGAAVLDQERARERDLETRLDDCILRAPHDGIAVYPIAAGPRGPAASLVAVGEPVRQGEKVIRVCSLERFLILTNVREADVSHLRADQPASVRVDAFPGRVLRGKIKNVSRVPTRKDGRPADTKVYPVEVELTDNLPGLKPGMSGEVRIETERRPKPVFEKER